MQTSSTEKRVCQFRLLKGKRAGEECGRPAWKKRLDVCLCLPHIRLLQNREDTMETLDIGTVWQTEYPQINKPQETSRTVLLPPDEPDLIEEAMQEVQMEPEKDDEFASILNVLDQIRRNIKVEKK